MKNLWILLVFLGFPALAGENFAAANAGIWHGVGIQVDAQDWPMELRLSPDDAGVDYASLECGGDWRYLKVDEEQVLAVEKITYGVEECLDGGLVRLQAYGDGMLVYRWFDNNGNAVAAAVLIEGPMRMDNYDALLRLTVEAMGKGFVKGPEAADVFVGEVKT